jgi:type I restriction enzyme, S subunit
MKNGWQEKSLKEICTKITDGSHSSPQSVDSGLPMASVKDLTSHGINLDSCRLISKEDFKKLVKYDCKPQKGDVLIAKDGATALDMVCQINEELEVVLLSSVAILRPDTNLVTASFLRYFMDSPITRKYLKGGYITGAAIPRIVLEDFKRAPIRYPSIRIQNNITSILSAYDDLIENNTRRIKILEEMARLIYHEWFVEWNIPVETSRRGVSTKNKIRLRKATPEEKKMTGKDVFPEGWEIRPLEDIVTDIIDYRGKTPKKLGSNWVEDGIIAISALNVKNGRLVSLEKSKYVSEELYNKWMKMELMAGDIIMTSEAPLGEVYFLAKSKKMCLSQRLFSIRANREIIDPSILYLSFRSQEVQQRIVTQATGTTVVGIRQNLLRKIPFVIPSKSIQNMSSTTLRDIVNNIDVLDKTITNLRRTRDLLLPKLISGEVEV